MGKGQGKGFLDLALTLTHTLNRHPDLGHYLDRAVSILSDLKSALSL